MKSLKLPSKMDDIPFLKALADSMPRRLEDVIRKVLFSFVYC